MAQPYNYSIGQVQNPLAGLQQGVQFGGLIGHLIQQRQAEQAAQQAQQRQQQFQTDLSALGTSPTIEQYQGIIAQYPEFSQQSKSYFATLSEPEKEAELKRGYELYGALESGNKELAGDLIDRNISAFQNSDDQESAQEWKDIKRMYEQNPDSLKTYAGLQLAGIDEKFGEKLGKLGVERRAEELRPLEKEAKELGISEQKLKIKKKQAELGKLADKAPAIKDPTTGRKEFTALSKEFIKQRDAYNRVQAAAEDPSPAGDLALIFNYMKVLDPGSVVRESEFATAAQTGAFGERIKAAVSKVVSGERLSDVQRADFVSRSGKLYEKGKKSQSNLESEYRRLAKKSKIDPADIVIDFSGGAAEEQAAAQTQEKTITGTRKLPDGRTVVQYSDGSFGLQ